MNRKKGKDLQENVWSEPIGLTVPDFVDLLPDASFMIDCDGKVILWNHAMEEMTGVAATEMLGRGNYEYALPFYASRRPMLIDMVLHPEHDFSNQYYLFTKNDVMLSGEAVVPNLRGMKRHLWGRAMLSRDSHGEIIGAVETLRDITDVKFSLDRLLLETEKCHQAFENIQDVYYEVSLDGTFMEISPSVKNVLGWQREELIGTSIAHLYANPADRDVFLQSITSEGGVYDYEIRLKHQDGSLLNISINARYFPGNDREPPRNIGSMRNITQRKKIEEALRISEERYRTLIENIPVAVNRTTPPPHGRFLMVNPAYLRMFGFSSEAEALMADPAEIYFDPAERETFAQRIFEWGGLKDYVMRFRKRDGTPLWGEMTAKAVYDKESGKALFFDCIIEDITARKKTEAEILQLAYYDGLTGLPNRSLFLDRLQMAIARSAREKNMVVLMMFDLDLFKDVNDTMGHPAGDKLLKAVAERLLRRLRKSDTIARLGGDEFMVIYTGVSECRQADMLAVKLLNVFSRPFLLGDVPVRITASVGVAVYPEDAGDLDMMLRNVDIALYKAKDDGGNSSRRYSGENEMMHKK
ncbi:MAG: sensor domain-containing protein [Syntrophales bacterium]